MVLNEWVYHDAISGETRDLVGCGNDNLSIQDIVIGIVASVDHKWEVDDKSCGVALTVGAGIWKVGRDSIVSKEL